MAGLPEQDGPRSLYPSPPPFYKHFTTENIARLNEFREANGIGANDSSAFPLLSASQLLSLPAELRYLVPPEPPAEDEQYRVFNEDTKIRQVLPSLEDWHYEQLYPSPPSPVAGEDPTSQSGWTLDRAKYLKDLVRSLILNFVELLGIVANNPAAADKDEKLGDIATIVANMHALINEYRPHQARETLINMMEEQLERKRAEVDGIRRMKEKVEETLAEFAKTAPESLASAVSEEVGALAIGESRKESQRQMWRAMDEILGH
ncbi:MED7-domain-containing protein [Lojkania enalia]|uniref:Mediator of RNA polymerase II transcription subunit 7 n=1 Tax=Lojkania enalia TaxID=147567 RepID=A0A9P4KFT2_9PLEO|nr:MED7-domain-containing protein [Didymosphaeria enalia]